MNATVTEQVKSIRSVRRGMIRRCYDKTSDSYCRYGALGIRVCDDWIGSPALFVKWALSNGYAAGLEIDRIDGSGNYCPENCRFITGQQNQWNKGRSIRRSGVACSSRFKGVSKRKGWDRWHAGIRVNGKRKHIGYFRTEEEAARAYDEKATELHGEFARLNFPNNLQTV